MDGKLNVEGVGEAFEGGEHRHGPPASNRGTADCVMPAAWASRVLLAAQRLFEQQGYPATTMAAVAAEGGVSSKTVYLAFDYKSQLLRAVWDVLLRGEQDRPVAQVEWFTEMLAEPDAVRQLRLNARNSRQGKERIGPLLRVIRNAAPLDHDVDALWELIQTDFYANQRVVIESRDRKPALQPGLTVDTVTDILWTLNHPTSGTC